MENNIKEVIKNEGARDFAIKQIDRFNRRSKFLWSSLALSAVAIGSSIATGNSAEILSHIPVLAAFVPQAIVNEVRKKNFKNALGETNEAIVNSENITNALSKSEEANLRNEGAREFLVKQKEKGYGMSSWVEILLGVACTGLYVMLDYMSHGSVRMSSPAINYIEAGAIGGLTAGIIEKVTDHFGIKHALSELNSKVLEFFRGKTSENTQIR